MAASTTTADPMTIKNQGGSAGPIALDALIPDWPSGPLDTYRKDATFNWKLMRKVLYGEKTLRFINEKMKLLESDPLFQRKPHDEPKNRAEYLKLTAMRLKKLTDLKIIDESAFMREPEAAYAFCHLMGQFDWSLYVKKAMAQDFFGFTAHMNGSKEIVKFVSQVYNLSVSGALLITELGHGSDTKRLMTTATYDVSTDEFILNTPTLEATKVWAGNLGQLATHGLVFAQLIADGQNFGLHQFLVPLRNSELLPFDGIKVGDMGPKAGLNGLDNGFLQFSNYRVPRSALLSKGSKFENGKFIQKTSRGSRTGLALGALSLGRIGVIVQSYLNLQLAMVIAIRYSAVRKQFGPTDFDGEVTEWPVIEYQTQQWRLFPYVACWYVLRTFHVTLTEKFYNFFATVAFGEPTEEMINTGAEIHALSCAGKAVAAWLARDGIQEAREACGGHGYLRSARLGDLRNDHDPNNTYEGDNNVLLQQTSNYLIKLYEDKLTNGKPIKTQLNICDYLDNYEQILTDQHFKPDANNVEDIVKVYEYMICYLTKISYEKLSRAMNDDQLGQFEARTKTQVYYLRTLSAVFFEWNAIHCFREFIESNQHDEKITQVFKKLLHLYALWSLEKNVLVLFQANFSGFNTKFNLNAIQERILMLCSQLKKDAVALVDAFAPSDVVINSCLGASDGQIYKRLFESYCENGSYKHPDWLRFDADGSTNDTSNVVPASKL